MIVEYYGKLLEAQVEWKLFGATNYELIVEYEPILSNSHVIIKYVEQGNETNLIEIFDAGYKQIGMNYEYNVPSTYVNNGLWNVVDAPRY